MPSEKASKPSAKALRWKRVLLKISGEALMGGRPFGHDVAAIDRIAQEVSQVIALGAQVALVVGGGNIFRGMSEAAAGMDRATADHMGMLATVINALALQDGLARNGIAVRAMSAIPMQSLCETFTRRDALAHLQAGRVVVFAGGTGNPYFTTDTAAALRAAEMNCDALLKGTQVDGVYSADPKTDASAVRYDRLSYTDVLARDLRVMDATAVSLCRENNIPILVYSNQDTGMLAAVLTGGGTYTLIDR
ncbi:MAG TPA: UMP kinase [Alphaproteobacteria bacterium]|nr:UMP kinase [Alphaproteobacteria bacterium]